MELSSTVKRRGSLAAVLLLVATFLFFASRAQGYQVPEPDLNDGGIWVTNEGRGLVGRTNAEIAEVDTKLSAASRDFDVLQSGEVVLLHLEDTPSLVGIDPARATLVPGAEIPPDAQVALGAQTAALFDPDTGSLYVTPATSSTAALALDPAADIEPVHTIPGAGSLAVGVDGLVHLYDPDSGEITTWDADGSRVATADVEPDLEEAVLTAVGDRPVLIDGERLLIPGSDPVDLDVGDLPVVQEPGPEADGVLVAGDLKLRRGRLRRRGAGALRRGDRRRRSAGPARRVHVRGVGRRPDLRAGVRRRRADGRRHPRDGSRGRAPVPRQPRAGHAQQPHRRQPAAVRGGRPDLHRQPMGRGAGRGVRGRPRGGGEPRRGDRADLRVARERRARCRTRRRDLRHPPRSARGGVPPPQRHRPRLRRAADRLRRARGPRRRSGRDHRRGPGRPGAGGERRRWAGLRLHDLRRAGWALHVDGDHRAWSPTARTRNRCSTRRRPSSSRAGP